MTMREQIEELDEFSVKQLQGKYHEVFSEPTRHHHRAWLVKRIAWRIQALAEGDLSDRARRRAEELANDADLRITIPKAKPATAPEFRTRTVRLPTERTDERLPLPGTILTREYKGRVLHVRVLDNGLEWDGQSYASLSAVAKAITGSHVNGYHFFRLTKAKVNA